MSVINTNTGALMARTYATEANNKMQTSMERLSSGLRINGAADDAAGLAVGNKMTASIKSYEMGVRNSANMISLLATAENSLSQILKMQLRIRELAVQSANGIYTDRDRDNLEIESAGLIREMDRLAAHTKFNGISLLDGSFEGEVIQTGPSFGDHIVVSINELVSSSLGRYWATTTFTNGDFASTTPVTSPSADVSAIPGWEIHNKRVELGQDGANGPANVNNRDNVSISNTIAGYPVPEDLTPRPFNNAVSNLVAEPTSTTTTDTALTYGVTHSGIIDPSPPDATDPGTYDVTVGALSSVTISSSTTTGNAALMNRTFNNVVGSAPTAGGTNAQFTVTVGEMTITPTTSTTDNAAMMGQSYTNVAGTGGSGSGALFNVTVGEMTTTPTSSTTSNTSMMGQTFTNIEASAPAGGGTTAKYTVTVGQMQFNETSGNSTSDAELFSTNYANISATTVTGGGSGATFDVSINGSGNITASVTNLGSGYNVGDQLRISGSSIGGGSDLILTIGAANVSINQTDAGSGYARGEAITILGNLIGGNAGADDIALTVGDANINISFANAGTGYAAGNTITIPGNLIGGSAGADDIDVTVGDANISVSVTNAGSGYKVGEQITILGSQLGATDGADNIVVNGNAATVSVSATSGSGYTAGGTVTLTGSDLAAGAGNLAIKTIKVPPGTDDSARPLSFGTLGDDSSTGYSIENGYLKLDSGSLTSVNGYDIVHGPYLVSSESKEISAGEKVKFDWKASGTNDAFDIFAYIVDVDTGATETLLNETQSPAGSTDWATVTHTVQTSGNYKYVFINGTYDDTGGKLLGAEMYLDNIYIERENLPAGEQHTVDKINLQTIANAENAVGILALAISQVSSELSKFGALINRLKHSSANASSMANNMKVARSRLFDAEYTIETSRLAKQQILANASAAMLAQANIAKQSILTLLD
ncbi:flagellin [Candidatus Puniceispirillum sp.]|nr:flagellin [Alphaproteobacteria bacterium]MDC1293952.1 flagellin [Candidatus Puniceispirillum sp.]